MRIALISDIHSNLEALNRVFERIDKLRTNSIYCLGDIVGYGPHAEQCVQLVRERCEVVVKGNHDAGVAGGLSIRHFERYGRAAIRWTKKVISRKSIDYLETLPLLHVRDDMTLAHATPHNPSSWRYIKTWPDMRECFSWFATKLCFIGHTHIPIVTGEDAAVNGFQRGQRYLINVGSVGQPRDGNAKASFGVLDTSAWEFEIVRVDYYIEVTLKAIRTAGLPDFLGQRLLQGV
jgi:diadenosine tetraphosphatase ApaH/serine/threonine PP2A family protein phosphatase